MDPDAEQIPPKPAPTERPPLDLANVVRQVRAIQEQLRREREARKQ